MLKIIRGNLSFIVPNHWVGGWGFLKIPAIYALKLFFNEITLEEALKGAKKKRKLGWSIKEVNSNENP